MADQFPELSEAHQKFIAKQKMVFIGTAARDGRVNVSPKGHECLKVVNSNEILWLNLTGSGNETAAHLLDTNRITLMWCAVEGPPMILRVYGSAEAIHPRHPDWEACNALLPAPLGARQYYRVKVEMVQKSCGYAVPLFDYKAERDSLKNWTEDRGQDGIEAYWDERNRQSIDGFPTEILG